MAVPRTLGSREDSYNMLVYCDASKDFVATAVYLDVIGLNSPKLIYARNSIVTKNLQTKSIPVLELVALDLGVSTAVDLCQQLCGAVRPINISKIFAFTDSMIVLSWLRSKAVEFGKVDRKQVFINNKLENIVKLCNGRPVIFDHITGTSNPADAVSRPMSANQLSKTNFHTGLSFCVSEESFSVPFVEAGKRVKSCMAAVDSASECVIDLHRFSSFNKTVKVMSLVFKFINNVRSKISQDCTPPNSYQQSKLYVVKMAQRNAFPEVYKSLVNKDFKHPLVTQMNLFLSDGGVIRVQSKLQKLRSAYGQKCPILMSKTCPVSKSVVYDAHNSVRHGGIYRTLALVRKSFWITRAYVLVKQTINQCIMCKRLNGRSLKLTQNAYKDYRVNPDCVPFRNIFIDHCGPFQVKNSVGVKENCYILVVTCLWSRGVNLILSRSLDKEIFVRALQLHVFEFGIPSLIVSDNGSQIVAGVDQTVNFLNDPETLEYLQQNNINNLEFKPYPAGASQLGAVVESMVKMVKKMIQSSVRNNVLLYDEFDFLISEVKMLINKRPLCFKHLLASDHLNEDTLEPLTPEIIIKGYEVPCVNVIPELHGNLDDWNKGDQNLCNSRLRDKFVKLKKVRSNLHSIYRDEFIVNLFSQSTDRKSRYCPVNNFLLQPGDIVSIKTDMQKPINFPLAIVVSVETNDLGEVVAARVRKSNGEILRRHTGDLIFITKNEGYSDPSVASCNADSSKKSINEGYSDPCVESRNADSSKESKNQRSQATRKAAQKCKTLNKKFFNSV